MKKYAVMLLTILGLLFVLSGCGEKEPEITGIWCYESEEDNGYMEIYSDGTGIARLTNEEGEAEKYDFTWIIENGRLKITLNLGILGSTSESAEYELTKDTLKLLLDSGEVEVYHRDDGTMIQDMMNEKDTSENSVIKEQRVTFDCADEIKEAVPENGLIQIDDMIFQYGCTLSEALDVIAESECTYTSDVDENQLIIKDNSEQVIFKKNGEWYFEFHVNNLTEDTTLLKECVITKISAHKSSKGNVFYGGIHDNNSIMTYDSIKNIMNDYDLLEEMQYYKGEEKINSISYSIISETSINEKLYVYFFFESDTGEMISFLISSWQVPLSYMTLP